MASSQIAYAGSDVVVTLNVIDSTGTHQAATGLNASRLSSHPSAVPVVTNPNSEPGVYVLTWSSLSPATSEGDNLVALIEGSVGGTAFSTYAIPLKVVANERGTDNASTFDNTVDTVITDTASRDASKADVSLLATAASIAALNDIAATDIVSAGAITTLNGAVANVDLVDVTTTNTDMVSVAGLSTFDPSTDQVVASNMRGTDNSLTSADVPSNFASLGINASGHISRVTLVDTTTTNTDMVSVSGLASSSDLATVDGNVDAIKLKTDQLTFTVSNQVDSNALTGGGGDDAATIYSYFTASNREDLFHADVSALSTSAEIAALNDISVNDIWDASLSSHNVGGSTGKALKQIKEATITIESSINDSSATTTQFVTSLTETTTSYYSNKIMVFIDGHLSGQARIITNYNGTTKAITLEEPLTSAPSDGDQFLILATHENSIAEIANGVWSDTQSSYTVDGTFGYYLDSQVSQAGAGGSGLYQLTVNVTDSSSGAALQGARINVDGTTLTLTTDSAGQCVFNLDSGVYTLQLSPPAGYQTPTGNVVVLSGDASSSFSLTETTSSGDCDVPWVG